MKKLFSISPLFRWYDLWIGGYIDLKNRSIYILPVPMLGVKITYPSKHELLYRFKWKKLCRYVSSEIHDGYGNRVCNNGVYGRWGTPVGYDYCLSKCEWRIHQPYKEKERQSRAKFIIGMFYR